jgi:putative salt-induced outer membrane protein
MKLLNVVSLCTLLFALPAIAAETDATPPPPPPPPWFSEAEAGAIVVSGNNDSESYNGKAKSTYVWDKNSVIGGGRYLQTTSLGIESARNWEAGLRYERELNDYFSLFVGQKAESDVYNGYVQRDSTDAGVKYFITKNDKTTWTAEAGYRYQVTNPTTGEQTKDSLGRAYTEFNQKVREDLTFKYWAEYLPNFSDADAYLANTEASLNIMLNSTLSLKLAYLLQYQNQVPAGTKYTTTTTTMNLVAKF